MGIDDFIEELQKMNFSLLVEDQKLVLAADESRLSCDEMEAIKSREEIIGFIREHREELIRHISSTGKNIFEDPSNRAAIYRLSGLQEGMLFHWMYNGQSGTYIEQFSCDLEGLQVNPFRKSWEHLVSRHSILRTGFYHDSFKIPVQCVYRKVQLPIEVLDYSGLDIAEREESIRRFEAADRGRGFSFKEAPLMRITLIRLEGDRYRMLWTHHHILLDGWSVHILMEEFLQTYESIMAGRMPLAEEEDKFEDYIRYLEKRDKEEEEAYWQHYLEGLKEGSLLPWIPAGSLRNKGYGTYREEILLLDATETERIGSFSQKYHLTVNTMMQGVWSYLLYRYTGNPHVVYGVTVSGRPDDLPDMERRVGMYINILPLHDRIDREEKMIDWLMRIQRGQIGCRVYQHTMLPDIQKWIGIPGDLFDSTMAFNNYAVNKEMLARQRGLRVENAYINEQSNYPLTITVVSGVETGVSFSYNSHLIPEAVIGRIRGHFEQVLRQLIRMPDGRVGDVELMTGEERAKLLNEFNFPGPALSGEKTFVDVFQQQAAATPDRIAVVCGDEEVSYRQLNTRANRLARYLRARSIGEGMPVPICIGPGLEQMAAMLGVLKAGGVFVPMDPNYPEARLQYILDDTAAPIVIAGRAMAEKFYGAGHTEFADLEAEAEEIGKYSGDDPADLPLPGHPAYVIYTSGSTGRPKGVLVEHRSLMNYLSFCKAEYMEESSNASGSFVHLSFTFDASLTALFAPFLAGKTIVFGQGMPAQLFEDRRLLEYAPYDFIKLTPAHLPLLEPIFSKLCRGGDLTKRLVLGGEALLPNHIAFLDEQAIGVEIVNEYGPTETTVGCSVYRFLTGNGEPHDIIPIGRPVLNSRIYVLDERRQLCPVGVRGELCIGGAGLARGYLNQPELTADRFVADPFNRGEMIYCTGDLGRWLENGDIEYLGRKDDQFKLRGYRIEPAEIEKTMNGLEEVEDCAVVLRREEDPALNSLAGYYIPDAGKIAEGERQLSRNRVQSWNQLYEDEYGKPEPEGKGDEEFNITGWNDSFTGGAIPSWQMKDWLEDIAGVILAGRPRRVLEIGCGTGLIYYRIAKSIESYTGTDFSKVAVEMIGRRVARQRDLYPRTRLIHCPAHEIGPGAGTEDVDTIVLNSVIQYFPGEEYLTSVLSQCIGILNEKGRVVVGDVRDLRLLLLFRMRLHLERMKEGAATITAEELFWNAEQEMQREEELCLSPEYFFLLARKIPGINHVDIRWKQADYINELSLYRYTVVLYAGVEKERIDPEWRSWDAPEGTDRFFEELRSGAGTIAICDMPNPRLWKERELQQAAGRTPKVKATVLLANTASPRKEAMEAQEILDLAREAGYQCRMFVHEDPMKMNVWFHTGSPDVFVAVPYSGEQAAVRQPVSNRPLYTDVCALLQKRILEKLQGILPDYMVPAELIAIRRFPLTANGKVDRRFLAARKNAGRTLSGAEARAPRNQTEERLAAIWKELLNVSDIGMKDDFFESGGHSLLAIRMISAIRKQFGMEVSVSDVFDLPTIEQLATRLAPALEIPAQPAVGRRPRPGRIPLSFSQERLWFIDRLEGSVPYHIPTVLRIHGELSPKAVSAALRGVVQRHESLRTVIREDEGEAYQEILGADGWELPYIEGGMSTEEIKELISAPFDLSAEYKLRGYLIRESDREHILAVVLHHIASDGWSSGILVKEFIELYSASVEDRPPVLQPLAVQYADYAIWQREHLSGMVLDEKLGYWKDQLRGVAPVLLPTDFPRVSTQRARGATYAFEMSRELTDGLHQLCRREGVTLYMLLLAVFKILLYRYTGQEDVCVGSPIAGRQHQEIEGLIGFFINTLALRSDLSGDPAFTELLKRVKSTTLSAFEHQEVPFEKVVEAVVRDRHLNRNPLFQTMFVLHNNDRPKIAEKKLGDLTIEPVEIDNATSILDLTLSITEGPGGLKATVEYCADRLAEDSIGRLAGHYIRLLEAVVHSPGERIGRLTMVTTGEYRELVFGFNRQQGDWPEDKTVVDLFEEQVARNPDAIALSFSGKEFSYGELDRQSGRLSNFLRAEGVSGETVVPICVERGVTMVVAILAVLKTGAAFVPMDPEFPAERIGYMLADSGGRLLLTTAECRSRLPEAWDGRIVEVGLIEERISAGESAKLAGRPDSNRLAYVIYTSGSTGRPKGVMIEHGSLVNFLLSMTRELDLKAGSGFLSMTTYSFDIFYLELFLPLMNGGRVILAGTEAAGDGFRLIELIARTRPDFIQSTPSGWQMLLACGWENECDAVLLSGGEALKEDIKIALTTKGKTYNLYGPTETTIWSSVKRLSPWQEVTIGRPLDNTVIYIMNESGSLSPIGIPGEICIGGAGLARGYLNKPELTSGKFVPDPFSPRSASRLYRTGDLGFWKRNGDVVCMGRKDEQLKIRGYRIEPGEIERVLEESGMTRQVAVSAKDNRNGEKVLAAYIVPGNGYEKALVIRHLQSRLPAYMIPSVFIELDRLPLTANGKTDRLHLPEVVGSELPAVQHSGPRNKMEEMLISIWERLLGLEGIDIHADFFELGGHSLLATRMVSAIRKEMDLGVPVRDLFVHVTPAQLGDHLLHLAKGLSLPRIIKQSRTGDIPLSFSQERLWFIDQMEGSTPYHIPLVLRLRGELHESHLAEALQKIVNRHEVLRTVVLAKDGHLYQQLLAADSWHLTVADGYPGQMVDKDRKTALRAHLETLISAPFNLAKEHPLRGHLMRISPGDHILVLVMHHIASDGWSIDIFMKELMELYQACSEGRVASLPPLPVQYADYAVWQRNYLQGDIISGKIDYWKKRLAGSNPLILPTDHPRPMSKSTKGAIVNYRIDRALSDALRELSQKEGVTLFMTLLTAYDILLFRYSGQEDVCVAVPIAGRQHAEVEGLIGMFINTLALRTDMSGNPGFPELLQRVKQATLEAYENQEASLERIIGALRQEREETGDTLLRVMFDLQTDARVKMPPGVLGDLEILPEEFGHSSSKFDIGMSLSDRASGIDGIVEYSTDLFQESTIRRMLEHYSEILRAITTNRQVPIGHIGLHKAGGETLYGRDVVEDDLFDFQLKESKAE